MLVDSWSFATRNQHRNVIAVKQDLIELRDAAAFGGLLELSNVFEDHVDEVVETEKCSDDLFVVSHDYVNARADTFVDQLEREQLRRVYDLGVLRGRYCC